MSTATYTEYQFGRMEGFYAGEYDRTQHLGLVSAGEAEARERATSADSWEARAYALGFLRGYREAVRTFGAGGWGI